MRYELVQNARRQKLIDLVYGESAITTREACKILNINLSTAKYILKIYRRQGRTYRKTKCSNNEDFKEEEEVKATPHSNESVSIGNISKHDGEMKVVNLTEPISQNQAPPRVKKDEQAQYIQLDAESSCMLKSMSLENLIQLISDNEGKMTTLNYQMEIVKQSYQLIDKLHGIVKSREEQILKNQQFFKMTLMPAILGEITTRQDDAAGKVECKNLESNLGVHSTHENSSSSRSSHSHLPCKIPVGSLPPPPPPPPPPPTTDE